MKEVSKKKNSGFAMRLMQAFVYLILVAMGVGLLVWSYRDVEELDVYAIITSLTLLPEASAFVIAQFVVAFVGNKSKGANIASIVFGALNFALWIIMWGVSFCDEDANRAFYFTYIIFALLGIFGIIGGAQGAKHGVFPKTTRKLYAGYSCRLAQAILDLFWALPFVICAILYSVPREYDVAEYYVAIIFGSCAAFFLLLAILQFIFAFKGNKSKGANVGSIIINAILALGLICLPGFIGGIQGVQYLNAHPEGYSPERKPKKSAATTETASEQQGAFEGMTVDEVLATVDYAIPADCEKVFSLSEGLNIVEFIRSAMLGEEVDGSGIGIFDVDGSELDAELSAYKVEQKGETNRLYLVVKGVGERDEAILSLFFVVLRADGQYGLCEERDEAMRERIHAWLEGAQKQDAPVESRGSKVKRFFIDYLKAWVHGIFSIGKEVVNFYGDVAKDTDEGKAFLRGFSGEDDREEYTIINEAGCEQTVYSRDGKKFYTKSGEYVGESRDGGKTIIFK